MQSCFRSHMSLAPPRPTHDTRTQTCTMHHRPSHHASHVTRLKTCRDTHVAAFHAVFPVRRSALSSSPLSSTMKAHHHSQTTPGSRTNARSTEAAHTSKFVFETGAAGCGHTRSRTKDTMRVTRVASAGSRPGPFFASHDLIHCRTHPNTFLRYESTKPINNAITATCSTGQTANRDLSSWGHLVKRVAAATFSRDCVPFG